MRLSMFVLVMVLSFGSLVAGDEDSSSLPFVPLTLTKPATLGALDWLTYLEEQRDEAELSGHRDRLDAIAMETKATLGGKYGLSNRAATPLERAIMIASIQRNCRLAPYGVGTMDDYLGYVPEEGRAPHLQADPLLASHLGALLAIVAITNRSLQSDESAQTWMACQQSHTPFPPDLHAAFQEEAHRQCSAPVWILLVNPLISTLTHDTSLLAMAWEGFSFLPPRLHLREVIDDLLAGGGGEDYKGWEVHGLSSLGRWPDIQGQSVGEALQAMYKACERDGGYWEPLLSRALCLTPGTPRCLSYLDEAYYDGKTWAVELMFTYNLEGQTPSLLNLVLTRKGPLGNTNLTKALDVKAKQEAYWSSLAYRPPLFTGVNEASTFYKAYGFDLREGGYDLAAMVTQGMLTVPFGDLRLYLAQSGFKGHAQALYALGTLWEEGKDGACDTQKARMLYARSADMGYAQAQYVYGTLLLEEKGGSSTPGEEAQRYLRRAAEQGHREAQEKLGEHGGSSTIHFDGELLSWDAGLRDPSMAHHRQALHQFLSGGSPDPWSFMDALEALSQQGPSLPRRFEMRPGGVFFS